MKLNPQRSSKGWHGIRPEPNELVALLGFYNKVILRVYSEVSSRPSSTKQLLQVELAEPSGHAVQYYPVQKGSIRLAACLRLTFPCGTLPQAHLLPSLQQRQAGGGLLEHLSGHANSLMRFAPK